MNPNQAFDLIIFDLGGVLIQYGGISRMKELTAGRWSTKELGQWWQNAEAVARFEGGRMSQQEFAEIIVEELGLPLGPNEFLEEAVGWFKGPCPGAPELLKELSQSYELATLCNTNALYWPMFEKTGLGRLFKFHFPSHLTGLLKPNARAFTHVIEQTGLKPEGMLFLDDTPANVEQARTVGMQAYRTVGTDEARDRLVRLGLLEAKKSG